MVRAAAVADLAARLKRTPQTIRGYLRKYGPRLSGAVEAIIKTGLDETYLQREQRSLNEALTIINDRLESAGLKPVSFNTVKDRLWTHWTAEEVA